MDGINKSMYDIASDSAFSILARTNELKSKGNEVINLCIGQPDFPTPKNIVEAACKALKDGHHGYTSSSGILGLREAVANDLFRRNNVIVEPGQILISPGAKAIIFYTLLMFGQPGAEVITPDPGFMAYKSLIDYTGAKAVFLPHRKEQNFSFNVDELLSLITSKTKLIILNSPGNPTGGVVPEKEFDKLANELSKYPNIYILSDEIYSKITFDNSKHKSLLAYPQIQEQVIMMDGWSKSYAMTGWRLGYGVYPQKLFPFAEKLAINCHSCVNTATQIAGIEALESRSSEVFVKHMVEKFQERKNFMVSELNKIKNVECCDPKGAFYVFPKINKKNFDSKLICSELLEKKFLATVPGSSFGDLGEGFLRISYASDLENLKKSIVLLKEYMNE